MDGIMTSANLESARELNKSIGMRIAVVTLFLSSFLLNMYHTLRATMSSSFLLAIFDGLWALSIALQISNIFARYFLDIHSLLDLDWIFLSIASIAYREVPIQSIEQSTDTKIPELELLGISVVSSFHMFPWLSENPVQGHLRKAKDASNTPSKPITPTTTEVLSERKGSTSHTAPFQRRSLFPNLHYHYGTTRGSPRDVFRAAKESVLKESEEQSAEQSEEHCAGLEQELAYCKSFHASSPITLSLSHSLESSAASTSPTNDDKSGNIKASTGLDRASTSYAMRDDQANTSSASTSYYDLCESWDNISRESAETGDRGAGGSADAIVDGDEESWIDIPPLIDGTLSMVSSSLREFMMGIDDAKDGLSSPPIRDLEYI
jgi:hypothetical protein